MTDEDDIDDALTSLEGCVIAAVTRAQADGLLSNGEIARELRRIAADIGDGEEPA